MKSYVSTAKFTIKQILKDYMLLIMIFAPLLISFTFKFGIPYVGQVLYSHISNQIILEPYYIIFDNLLIFLIPLLYCWIMAMIMVEEKDDKISSYIYVTPVGKKGYFFIRLVLPGFIGFLIGLFSVCFFLLVDTPIINSLIVLFLATLCAVLISLITVTKSNNKVEAMAIAKFMGSVGMALAIPYFINNNVQYLFSFLPTFWLGKIYQSYGHNLYYLYIMIGYSVTICWLIIIYKSYKKSVSEQ